MLRYIMHVRVVIRDLKTVAEYKIKEFERDGLSLRAARRNVRPWLMFMEIDAPR